MWELFITIVCAILFVRLIMRLGKASREAQTAYFAKKDAEKAISVESPNMDRLLDDVFKQTAERGAVENLKPEQMVKW